MMVLHTSAGGREKNESGKANTGKRKNNTHISEETVEKVRYETVGADNEVKCVL